MQSDLNNITTDHRDNWRLYHGTGEGKHPLYPAFYGDTEIQRRTSSAWACLLSSCIVLCLCIYVTARIPCNGIVSLLMLAAVISLGICSPVDSENRQLDPQEKKKYKKITIWIAMAFFAIYVLLLLLRLDYYAKWIAAGLILPAISQIPVALKRISGKYRERN